MAELTISKPTRLLLDAYLHTPAHALLLTGEPGSGLRTTALYLADTLSGDNKANILIEPEKGLIPIDRIRQLYEQTKGISQSARCIVIDDADTMSPDAQNSLLKLLEEPTAHIYFILTSHLPSALLATVRSRVQTITVGRITEAASKTILSSYDMSDTHIAQAMFLAAGKPAELTRLASDEAYMSSRGELVTDARTLLQSDTYTRLKIIKGYTDRAKALELLHMLSTLLTFTLIKQRQYAVASTMADLDEVIKRIDANGHTRTHLMHLVTKLP